MRNTLKRENVYIIPETLFAETPIMLMVDLKARKKENVRGFLKALAQEIINNIPINNKEHDDNLLTPCVVYNLKKDAEGKPIVKNGMQTWEPEQYFVTNNIFRRLKRAYKRTNGMQGVIQYLQEWKRRYGQWQDVQTVHEGTKVLERKKVIPKVLVDYFDAIIELVNVGRLPCRDEVIINTYRENWEAAKKEASGKTVADESEEPGNNAEA